MDIKIDNLRGSVKERKKRDCDGKRNKNKTKGE